MLMTLVFSSSGFTQTPVEPTPVAAAVSPSPLVISGYVGAYYAWDNDKRPNQTDFRQFSFIAPQKEQVSLDIAQISAAYSTSNVRAKATLQFGDVTRQWSGGNNPSANYIQEANAGFMLADKLWLDAGFFLTHIGAEGFFPKDNFMSSLALTTNFEPFGQGGAKLSYQFSDQFSGQFLVMNSYGGFYDNNANKHVGIQLDYKA
ncbi:MAG: outer membrane beta-barrel protein, partial [Rhizobacter sp.]|nr:outer membrane beta-barrel protein [Chlorobiales bacterium]